MRKLPDDLDKNRWSPAEDRRGNAVKAGDYVSVSVYPRGTVRGTLVVSDSQWTVLPDGSKVQSLMVRADKTNTLYEATSKILKLEPGVLSRTRLTSCSRCDAKDNENTRGYWGPVQAATPEGSADDA